MGVPRSSKKKCTIFSISSFTFFFFLIIQFLVILQHAALYKQKANQTKLWHKKPGKTEDGTCLGLLNEHGSGAGWTQCQWPLPAEGSRAGAPPKAAQRGGRPASPSVPPDSSHITRSTRTVVCLSWLWSVHPPWQSRAPLNLAVPRLSLHPLQAG